MKLPQLILTPKVVALASGLAICVASAQQILLDPNDPVILPTDEEVTQIIKNIRESSLKMNQHDKDGWDDLWVMMQQGYDKNYKFDPTDRKKDTDGDGMSDYEEMLVHRNATYKEPVYTKEQRIEQVREDRRRAIKNFEAIEKRFQSELAAAQPNLRELIPDGGTTTKKDEIEEGERTAALARDAAVSRLLTPGKERELNDIARRYGVEKVIEDENGKKLILSGELLGPIYIQSNDTLSSAGISADEVWPIQNNASLPGYFPWSYTESHTGLSLSGAGQTLGLWEVDGGVRTTHVEMGTGRVFQKDGAALDTSSHATYVAGTMAAAGVGNVFGNFYESRGVAYQATVFAYATSANFQTDRENAAAGNGTDPPLRASNHSWGFLAGWRREDIDPTAGTNLQWVWYGPTAASFQEDFKFGFYFADQTVSNGCTQMDFFMRSQAPQHLMVYACGNDRSEGPGTSPGTYYYRNGTSFTPVSAAAVPRDWDDGDDGFYDTLGAPGTAKNVLTIGACEDVFQVSGSNLFIGYGPTANVVPSSFSGVGPTDDGRIKPDLVAVGSPSQTIRQPLGLMFGTPSAPVILAPSAVGNGNYTPGIRGTSFAAPAVTGALGLVMQRRAQLYPTLPAAQAWQGSTLKAIAINTCDDVGAEGPDYRLGYGVMNARTAVLAVDADYAQGRGSLIKEFTLTPSQTVSWNVISDGSQPLSVTLPWSDVPGPALTTVSGADAQNAMLVNNIDLKVEYFGAATSSTLPSTPLATFLPWTLNPDLTIKSAATRALPAARGVDIRNNVEKVSIASPAAGRYRITVTHSGGLAGNPAPVTQVVSAALSGVTAELPKITQLIPSAAATQFILSFSADPGAYFTIQSSEDLITWTNAGSVLAENVTNSVVVTSTAGNTKRFWRMRRGQ